MRALEMVLGAPPSELAENPDCGARLAIWAQGVTTWFASERFVGWSAGSDAQMSSAGGLRVGMSRHELENGATSVHIAPSTLGTEFDTAGMGGLLDSDRADARVSHLWAGATCIAR